MIHFARRVRTLSPLALIGAGALALAGCAHRGPVAAPPPPVPMPAADHQAEVASIVALLDRGDTATAAPRIDALLKRDPADPQAAVLRASLDQDPVALLGPKSFPYTVKPGETMLGLAERFLGTSLKSFQLARYNGIAVPASLAAGTELKIPGTPPRVETPPPPKPRRPAAPGKAKTPAAPPAPGTPAPATPPAGAAAARADTAAARQARTAGLAALNAGQVDRAVGLLRRAAQLDPADPLIARDLQRATRIAATVHARR